MRKWGLTLLAVFLTIILTACNQNDSKDEDKKETSEKTSQKKEAYQDESGEGFKVLKEKELNSQRNKKTTNDSSDNQIIDYTDKQKIAMLLFQPGLDDKFITADDVLKGEYQSKFSDGVKKKHLPKLTVTSLPENTQMDNTPTGTKFYNIQPFPSQYSVNIAMNEHNMIIFGSQSPIPDYNELLHGLDGMAKVYKTKDVIKSEKDNPKLKEVEDKVDMQ
ncbi:hypothetical protein [Staphylococcus carnosus]|uniref:hypothetical protein n=1 Tax=Staphylococcus carnosus TaxID=1281 RepID=UPI00081A76A6|nr:hypothetical protein [Staphylococcus carnosus]ANZ32423.1 hypothetical protein BEK99_00485 [Staphylococcus carnosus]UTB84546.1 hypothetical protein A2I66_02100 [Staphylococcus carnosus]